AATGFAADRVASFTGHGSVAPSTFYTGLIGAGVKKSIDSGATWSSLVAGFPTSGDGVHYDLFNVNAIAASPFTPNTVYAGLSGPGLYANTGSGWSIVTGGGLPATQSYLPQDLQFDAFGNIYYVLFDPNQGVYQSPNGTSWSLIRSGANPDGAGAARFV